MRLQVALAHAGCASRRKCARFIKEGRVRVNGKVITEPGFKIDISKDRITHSGKKILLQDKTYLLLNKPKDVITSVSDTHARKTVLDLIPKNRHRLYPVGRLDKDTTGLLLITNDGELAFRLTHPKFEVERVYEVAVKGEPSNADMKKLEKGIYLEGRRTASCKIEILKRSLKKSLLRISLHEGRKRQIRNMFKKVGYPVTQLKRIKFGPLELRGLKTGEYRNLKGYEIESLLL